MATLQIRLFGAGEITLDGKVAADLRSDKARALLAYLAVEPARHIAVRSWPVCCGPAIRNPPLELTCAAPWPTFARPSAITRRRRPTSSLRRRASSSTPPAMLRRCHHVRPANQGREPTPQSPNFPSRARGLAGRSCRPLPRALPGGLLDSGQPGFRRMGVAHPGAAQPPGDPGLHRLAEAYQARGDTTARFTMPGGRWRWTRGRRAPTARSCSCWPSAVNEARPLPNSRPAADYWPRSWASSLRSRPCSWLSICARANGLPLRPRRPRRPRDCPGSWGNAPIAAWPPFGRRTRPSSLAARRLWRGWPKRCRADQGRGGRLFGFGQVVGGFRRSATRTPQRLELAGHPFSPWRAAFRGSGCGALACPGAPAQRNRPADRNAEAGRRTPRQELSLDSVAEQSWNSILAPAACSW